MRLFSDVFLTMSSNGGLRLLRCNSTTLIQVASKWPKNSQKSSSVSSRTHEAARSQQPPEGRHRKEQRMAAPPPRWRPGPNQEGALRAATAAGSAVVWRIKRMPNIKRETELTENMRKMKKCLYVIEHWIRILLKCNNEFLLFYHFFYNVIQLSSVLFFLYWTANKYFSIMCEVTFLPFVIKTITLQRATILQKEITNKIKERASDIHATESSFH